MRKASKAMLVASALSWLSPADADWSANIGWASDYIYRGSLQAPSSASGGIDFKQGGFYAGSWAADVDDGLEVDAYFGYAVEIDSVSYGIGFTGYYYTGDFDDTYQEINLSAGYGYATLDLAVGEYDNFGGPTEDYAYYALTIGNNGFYGKYAIFARDFDGDYLEFGYGTSVAEIDLALCAVFANEGPAGESSESLVFTIGKTFDLN